MLARRLTKAKLNPTNCDNRLCSIPKNNNWVITNKQKQCLELSETFTNPGFAGTEFGLLNHVVKAAVTKAKYQAPWQNS